MSNFVTKAYDFIRKSITPNAITENFLTFPETFEVLKDYFGWSMTYGINKYLKSYGENPLVFMIVNKIAFSSASIKRIAVDEEGNEIDRSMILELLKKPNSTQGEQEFKQEINEYLLLTGNSYTRLIRSVGIDGYELENLNPKRVELKINDVGEVVKYHYKNRKGKIEEIEPEDMLHIKTSNVVHTENDHDYLGLSPLEAGWIVVESSTEKLKADASIFKNRGVIGILSSDTDNPMLKPERERLQKELDEEMQGSKKFNKIKISSTKMKYIQTGMSPTDLKLLEGILSSLRLLCSIYSMPSVLFNDNETSTYNNISEAKKTAYLEVYIPLADKIDREFSKWLGNIMQVEERIVADLTSIELIKSSTNELGQAINSMLPNVANRMIEVLTIDELRSIADLDSLGDKGKELVGKQNTKQDEGKINT